MYVINYYAKINIIIIFYKVIVTVIFYALIQGNKIKQNNKAGGWKLWCSCNKLIFYNCDM
jgi:hypothetical protein